MATTSFFSLLDRVIAADVSRATVALDVSEAGAYNASPAIQEMNTEFTALDTKASALVSHLSIMIAAVSILHASAGGIWLKRVFLAEIIFYAVTLLIILRVVYYSYYSEISLDSSGVSDGGGERTFVLMCELKKRMIYYRLGHNLAYSGTFLLLLSLFAALLF